MKKKLTALLTTFLAVLSLLPTGAGAVTHPSTEVTADCVLPDIVMELTVSPKYEAVINPWNFPIQLGDTVEDQQIITPQAYIENKSVVPVYVSATVTGAVDSGSDMKMITTNARSLTYKAAQVFFQMQAVADLDDVSWSSTYNAKRNILVEDGKTNSLENFVTIGAASEDDHFGAFRLNGNCARKLASGEWTENDGFTATIVFTFKPRRLTTS
jgi:hypothetical protein